MAMTNRVLKGIKSVGKALTTENKIADGGGLSSLLVPRKVNGAGMALIVGGGLTIGLADSGIKSRNQALLGKVSYGDGMARMTGSFTSGAVPAMKRASGGNYEAFSDMAKGVVSSGGYGAIEDYGATPELISALYNMGGR